MHCLLAIAGLTDDLELNGQPDGWAYCVKAKIKIGIKADDM